MKEELENKRGVTLVSLVVTIIILMILAGISINMTIGNNGIITIAKKAKENTELARIEEETKLNELYKKIGLEGGEPGDISYDSIAKLNDFKKRIADYIEEAGGIKPEYTANVETFGDRIKGIVKEVTKNATATPEDIQEGKTAWVNGELITGNNTSGNEIKKVLVGTMKGNKNAPNATNRFDCRNIDGWENLTANNFSFETTEILGQGSCSANNNFSNKVSISYNKATGIVTLGGGSVDIGASNGQSLLIYLYGNLYCYTNY